MRPIKIGSKITGDVSGNTVQSQMVGIFSPVRLITDWHDWLVHTAIFEVNAWQGMIE